jgi:hypothetical protein
MHDHCAVAMVAAVAAAAAAAAAAAMVAAVVAVVVVVVVVAAAAAACQLTIMLQNSVAFEEHGPHSKHFFFFVKLQIGPIS